MDIRKTTLLLAAFVFFGSIAGAQIRPGPRPQPPPYPGPGPHPGPHPGPMPPPNQGGQLVTRSIFVNRFVMNESLSLRQLAGLDWNFDDASLDSVRIEMRGRPNSSVLVELIANNRVEDSVYNPQGSGTLLPRGQVILGRDQNSLRLNVRNQIFIDRITVTVRDRGNHGPVNPGSFDVSVNVNRSMYNNERLDIGQYVNLAQYRGYRIQAVQVEAMASYQVALADLLINSFNRGTVQFDHRGSRQSIALTGAVLGSGAESLILQTRGELVLRTITLRLSR